MKRVSFCPLNAMSVWEDTGISAQWQNVFNHANISRKNKLSAEGYSFSRIKNYPEKNIIAIERQLWPTMFFPSPQI